MRRPTKYATAVSTMLWDTHDVVASSTTESYRLIDLALQGKLSNTEVDQRMVKALSDLPSDLGLEAVDKFATSNLESVRSKTGFMVGAPLQCLSVESRSQGVKIPILVS